MFIRETHMNNFIETRGMLAKLLATENLTVEHVLKNGGVHPVEKEVQPSLSSSAPQPLSP